MSGKGAGAHHVTAERHGVRLRSPGILLGLVRRGDSAAFAQIYERYHQELYRYRRRPPERDGDWPIVQSRPVVHSSWPVR